LLIIAAGMGSRYGGLKQIASVGPNGEMLIEYSVYDAIKVGFGKVVFVIRHYFEEAFKKSIGSNLDGLVETAYAYQELDTCLEQFPLSGDREKPWGTGHAVLIAKDLIGEPFAVINADDYYGRGSFELIANQLCSSAESGANDYSMVGYTLRDTLSEHGHVARGVCRCDEQMYLAGVVEMSKIERVADGIRYFDEHGRRCSLTGDEAVSMNFWGFKPSIFGHLDRQFREFLKQSGSDPNAEFYIPMVVDNLIRTGQARVKVLATNEPWFGITYRRDRDIAAASIKQMIGAGLYPEKLWQNTGNCPQEKV